MLRLRTLGGLAIDGAPQANPGAALQRRRLALLAVIAASDAGITRDKLLGLLWPEAPEERGRRALNQALHALRRGLGPDGDLFLGTHRVQLNPERISVDRWEFERHVAANDHAAAVSVYAGPFLDGVFLDDAPEFDRWVDAERARLAQSYERALHALATAADARSDSAAAISWWRQLATVDPLDSRAALGLMRALARGGDYAAALRHAAQHDAYIRAELDIAPVREISELAREIRSRAAAAPPTPAHTERRATLAILYARPISPEQQSAAPVPAVAAKRTWQPPARLLTITAVVLFAVAVTFARSWRALASPGEATRPAPDSSLVAVFPFDVLGDKSADLRVGIADLLRGAIDGAGAMHAVDTRAILARLPRGDRPVDSTTARVVSRDLGAGLVVTGEGTAVRDGLQISATLYDLSGSGARIAQFSAKGPSDSLMQLVDRIAVGLVAAPRRAPAERLATVAARTTTSLSALKLYLAAEQQMRELHYADAIPLLRQAVRLDTGFALAYYRMSIAADWSGDDLLADSAAEEAARRMDRLSRRDEMLVEALRSWRRRNIDEADREYRTALLHNPTDLEAWYQLGELNFHDNPARGLLFTGAETPFRRALSLEPTNKDAMQHLMRIAQWTERWALLDSMVTRTDPARSIMLFAPYRALASRDDTALENALAALRVVDANALYVISTRLALYGRNPALGARTLVGLVGPDRPPNERAIGFRARASLSAARGRWRQSRAFVDSLRVVSPLFALETEARLALVPFAPVGPGYLRDLRQRVDAWRSLPADTAARAPGHPASSTYTLRMAALSGHLAARMNDSRGVKKAMAAMESRRGVTADERRWLSAERELLVAELAESRGMVTRADDQLEPPPDPLTWGDVSEVRFGAARFLLGQGHLPQAARWFGSFEQVSLDALPWAAPAHLFRAETLERLGRRSEAAAEYDRIGELWRDCDAALVPLRSRAQERASRLRHDAT